MISSSNATLRSFSVGTRELQGRQQRQATPTEGKRHKITSRTAKGVQGLCETITANPSVEGQEAAHHIGKG
jgi:hypothetical protein